MMIFHATLCLLILSNAIIHVRGGDEAINFDGQSFVIMKLVNRPISSYEDVISFRFQTNNADGALIYSKGVQNDLLSLKLTQNKLLLTLDLGNKGQLNFIESGSLLDDGVWHFVSIKRERRRLTFSIDGNDVVHEITGDFVRLDLNEKLYIGGLPSSLSFVDGIFTKNFTGCIKDLQIFNTKIIDELQNDVYRDSYIKFDRDFFGCQLKPVVPVTFQTPKSYITIDVPVKDNFNISFDFRTFNGDGILFTHTFNREDYVHLFLEGGKLSLNVRLQSIPNVPIKLRPFEKTFHDGLWHEVSLSLERNLIAINADNERSVTVRLLDIMTSKSFKFGGGSSFAAGFIGCMRLIAVDGIYVDVKNIRPENKVISNPMDIVIDECKMIDRCHPNPCEHGGHCRQSHSEFHCDCVEYAGAVCHVPKYPLSCESYQLENHLRPDFDTYIDVDGSGPLAPFQVTCKFQQNGQTLTVLRHKNEGPTSVVGYEEPGSYRQDITYYAPFEQISVLVNKSKSCRQNIRYECWNSRLFNTPYGNDITFRPSTWWMSRNNQQMKYWGGSLPGSRKCKCGLFGQCVDKKKWCNCDAVVSPSQQPQVDEGDIMDKDFLPVRSIRIGDTGISQSSNKKAIYTIGSLVCTGDNLFDNVITFRKPDANILIPRFNLGYAADIYLQFKTTSENGVLFHAYGKKDFVKLSITGSKEMQFTFHFGGESRKIDARVTGKITDNQWHSVTVEWNKKEARLVIDSKHPANTPIDLDYAKAIQLTSDFSIGSTVEGKEGFVGCVRALSINGHFVDLLHQAMYGDEGRPMYGISPGCAGKCQSNPCRNNGTCYEQYSGFKCDCQWTAFKGTICADETGVNLRSDNYIQYDFESTISTLEENIRVGFVTTEHRGLIIGVTATSNEYLYLEMTSSGSLRLTFDFGFERQEIIIKNENFALGQHHDVSIRRSNKGSVMTIVVDNYEPIVYTFKIADKADAQFNGLKSIFIGKNDTMRSGEGFVGCISRVSFDDHFPLSRYFEEKTKPNVRSFPESEVLRLDNCGIESIIYPDEPIEHRPHYTSYNSDDNDVYTTAIAIIAAVLMAALIILILLFFISGRFIAGQKGDYITQEDKGARDALDPDTAVVRGKIGPDIALRKEYFI